MIATLREADDVALARYRRAVDRLLRQQGRIEDEQVRRLFDLLKDVRRRVIDDLGRLADPNGLAWKPFELRNLRDAIDQVAVELTREYRAILGGAVDRAFEQGELFQSSALDAIGVELRAVPQINRQSLVFAQELAGDLVVKVGREFREKANRSVTLGVMGARQPFSVMKDIEGLLKTEPGRKDPRLGSIAYQAERIQREEMLSAFHLGNGAAQTALNDQVPGLKKIWLTAKDGRVRPSHVAAGRAYAPGGEPGPIAMDQDYRVGGESAAYPHDPRLSTANRILCRCTSVAWSADWQTGKEPSTR